MMLMGSIAFLAFLGFSRGIMQKNGYELQRKKMVAEQIAARGVRDNKVLRVMTQVPRHLFVPETFKSLAYTDSALPIGYEQTISQPYIVAFMTEMAQINSTSRVLEIGTGCGYQAAILSRLCKEVYTIEIIKPLAEQARELFSKFEYSNITVLQRDGRCGWPEKAPFDVIIMTAAPEKVPDLLLSQLKIGGTLIGPVGGILNQKLMRYTKLPKGKKAEVLLPVSFVPLIGKSPKY